MSAVIPLLSLPGDTQAIAAALGGPEWAGSDLSPHLQRAVAAQGLVPLISLAEARPAASIELYRTWLSHHGKGADAAPVWFNLGVALQAGRRLEEAAAAMETAWRLRPELWQAALGRGQALEADGRSAEALAAWRMALPLAEARRQIHVQMARLLEAEGLLGPAMEEARAALLIDPAQPDVVQHLVHNRQRTTAWPPAELAVPGLAQAQAEQDAGPLAALALVDDPRRQAEIAAAWVARKVPAPTRVLAPQGYAHDRIRLGYLSSDFCRHAMSFLIADLLERHDRSRFAVWGFDLSPDDGSALRTRILAALDHHVPLRDLTDDAAADAIRAAEIDILIDLNGLTRGARPGILRQRPAPVQATYLGYIGPVPVPELDWLICDAVTVPHDCEGDYQPRPLRIDGCYQANDSRPPVLPAVSRGAEGLPDGAFVFCCHSHHYKLTEDVWQAWCRIVLQVPGSVLWLIDDTPESRMALTDRWVGAGLAAERLVFAPRTDPDRYRARLALADLFLDTSPYNAGTIASDALRMGLPVLTTLGRSFAARMGASLLTAVGLPDCIAADLSDYEARAIRLARTPALMADLRAHLAGGAWNRTLGDGAGFARRFEAALQRILV